MKKIYIITIALLLCIVYFIISEIFNLYIPCFFHKITKLYCPGCGVTRMIISIYKGNLYQAYRYNQLLFITFPIFIIYIIDYIYKAIIHKETLVDKTPNYVWYIFIVLLIIFGIIRNIYPYFAPTII